MKKIISYSAGAFLALALALTPALAITDTTPPSAPGSLAATAISAGQINLAWTAATDDVAVAAYIIFRNGSPVGFATTNAFSDTGLTASTAYSYTVKALDTSGNYSAYSNTATATTLSASTADTIAPSAPTGLIASAISDRQINLIWTATTDNVGVTSYQVFRNGTLIGTSSTTSFSDTGLTANTAYTYTVKALDAAGNVSAESAPTSATTLSANSNNRGRHHDDDEDEDEDDDDYEEEYESEGPNGHEHWHIHGHGQGHAYGLSKNKHHDDD